MCNSSLKHPQDLNSPNPPLLFFLESSPTGIGTNLFSEGWKSGGAFDGEEGGDGFDKGGGRVRVKILDENGGAREIRGLGGRRVKGLWLGGGGESGDLPGCKSR